MNPSDDVVKKLDALWQSFLPAMISRLSVVGSAIRGLEAGQLDGNLRIRAAEEAHKLAGSLGTFGLAAASRDALRIEALLSSSIPIRDCDLTELSQLLETVRQAIEGRASAH